MALKAVSISNPVSVAQGGTGVNPSNTSQGLGASRIISSLPSRNIGAVPLGDSITAGSNGVFNGVPAFIATTDYIGSALMQSGGRFNYIANAGVAGDTTAQMLLRVPAVIAQNPNIVPILGGTNDLPSITNAAGYANTMNNLEKIVVQLLEAGILPVLSTTPPNNTSPLVAKRLQWFIYELANFYGIPLIDIYKIWVDPTTSGSYLAAYSGDGTHPNKAGVAAVGSAISAVLSNLAQPQIYPYFGSVTETTTTEISNLVKNGNLKQQGTPPNPDFWNVNTTNASYASAVATYPYTGATITYTLTVAAGQFALDGAPISAGTSFVVGDTIYLAARVNVSGLTPSTASGYQILAALSGGGANYKFQSVCNGDCIFTGSFVVPTGTTAITPDWFVQDVGVYIMNNFTLVNVTQQNAIWKPGQQGI